MCSGSWVCRFPTFPQAVITVFGQENELYNDFAQQCFRIYLFCVFVIGFQITSSIYFQATGRPVRAAILSLSRMILFLVPLMLILPLFMGLSGILYAGPIADGMAGILAAIFIFFEMKSLKKKEQALLST